MDSSLYEKETGSTYTMATIMEEVARCLLCDDAPCSMDCPAGTDPGKFIRSLRFRNPRGAAETIRENNALGGICARVCPTERYCQKACSRSGIDRPIDIGGIQRFVTDFEHRVGMKILKAGASNGRKIAIVGSGPAGLEAAALLRGLGYGVTIFEEKKEPGGYLRYGIPEYRLPNTVVDVEIQRIRELGADFKCGVKVGKGGVTLDSLKQDYDAILVATGFSEPKTLPMFRNNPIGETAANFLARVKNRKGQGIELPDNIVVIGGGDVAMDVATTLKCLGVKYVTDVIYEEFSEFLASKKELDGARHHGVTIIDGYAPIGVEGKTITFKHRHIPSELRITTDKIILAVGQKSALEDLGLTPPDGGHEFSGCTTSDDKIYVAGDIMRGDKTVVWSVRKAKEAVYAIHSHLERKGNNQ